MNQFGAPTTLVKAPHQKLMLTQEQQREFIRCAIDPLYFIENYVWIQHPTQGKQQFKLFDYQREMISIYHNYKDVVSMCSRQLGKTTTAGAFILWFAIFQEDQNILVASNVFKAATEIMDRVRFSYEHLPDWLRPGVTVYNVQKIVFENRSKIESTTTTSNSGRGKSISLLFCDELAAVNKRIAEEFWTAISPTLATGGKCIICSTPGSDEDTFAQIWYAANRTQDEYGNERPDGVGINGFKAFKATWNQHPDRDQAWAAKERAKLGYEKFAREYELQFITADATLIDSKVLATLQQQEPLYKTQEIRWYHPVKANHIYLISLDPSAGVAQDYAAIQVWRLPDFVQVAEWMHNRSSVATQLKILIQICQYLDRELRKLPDHLGEPDIYWTYENNSYGQSVTELLNEVGLDVIPAQIMNEPQQGHNRMRRGLNTNMKTKSMAVTKLKSLVETNKMHICSKQLISQLKNYVSKGDSFAAKSGEHDDLVSALLLVIRMSMMIGKWDDLTAAHMKDDSLLDIEQLVEPMPISMGW
jgi:hypothetical protein